MFDYTTIKLLHRHGNDDYAPMAEGGDHGPETHDPERSWLKGSRIFRCTRCDDEVLVSPPEESLEHPFQVG
jgi:hypothetical protein